MTSSGEYQRRHPNVKTIYVDFDATLTVYNGWNGGALGPPVAAMVERVKRALAAGHKVVIFTARLSQVYMMAAQRVMPDAVIEQERAKIVEPIQAWCREHLGVVLTITCIKGFEATEFWDDRAVRVAANTGEPGPLDGTLWASLDE